MVDVLFRMAFLMLYAAAWLLVAATLIAAHLVVILARWSWVGLRALFAFVRERRRRRQQGPAAGRLVVVRGGIAPR
jgi:hypothetical protein